MRKAIVTGACGFIGRALVECLCGHGVEVLAIGRPGTGDRLPKLAGITFLGLDLADIQRLPDIVEGRDWDTFYHLGWNGVSGRGRNDCALQLENVKWAVNAVYAAKAAGCQRFIGAGSIVEKEAYSVAFAQNSKPALGYIYGGGKFAAHIMSAAVAQDIGLDFIGAHISNVYGAGEISERLVVTTLRKIIDGEPLEFTSGTQNYDFVYIDDAARAMYLIGEKGKPFCNYLIGSSAAKPLREFVLDIKETLAPETEFHFGNMPFTGVNLPLSDFDCSKTFEDVGFTAEVPFAEGIKRTYQWLLEQGN